MNTFVAAIIMIVRNFSSILQGFIIAKACANAIVVSPVPSCNFPLNIIQYTLNEIIVAGSSTIQVNGLQYVRVFKVRFYFHINLETIVKLAAKGDHAMIYSTRPTVSKSYRHLTAATFSQVCMPSCVSVDWKDEMS